MNDDLISRADAIQAVRHAWAKGLEPSQYIEIVPAVDAEPVVHGEWKWSHGGQCSECGFHNSNFDYNYCPNCGAKMDGGNKDDE